MTGRLRKRQDLIAVNEECDFARGALSCCNYNLAGESPLLHIKLGGTTLIHSERILKGVSIGELLAVRGGARRGCP